MLCFESTNGDSRSEVNLQRISGQWALLCDKMGFTRYVQRCFFFCSKLTPLGINRSLHAEISPLGLGSICFNLGGFRTSFLTPDHYTPYESRILDYVETATQADESFKGIS